MLVSLIDFTGKNTVNPARYAANILVFTKNTRLSMDEDFLHQVQDMTAEEINDQLLYISNTIPSSHEFVHYSFLLDGVSRAFTAQLCRTRTASFAEKTLRIMNVGEGSGWEYQIGPTIASDLSRKTVYNQSMESIATTYKQLIADGAAVEDARGILPLNIKTRICMSLNLRTFCEMVYKRSSPRVQGEYREAISLMKAEVLRVHPFVSMFIERTFDRAAADLDVEINELPTSDEHKVKLRKLVDQLRAKQ
jgi:flavin-dependent thymidylate synthase